MKFPYSQVTTGHPPRRRDQRREGDAHAGLNDNAERQGGSGAGLGLVSA